MAYSLFIAACFASSQLCLCSQWSITSDAQLSSLMPDGTAMLIACIPVLTKSSKSVPQICAGYLCEPIHTGSIRIGSVHVAKHSLKDYTVGHTNRHRKFQIPVTSVTGLARPGAAVLMSLLMVLLSLPQVGTACMDLSSTHALARPCLQQLSTPFINGPAELTSPSARGTLWESPARASLMWESALINSEPSLHHEIWTSHKLIPILHPHILT